MMAGTNDLLWDYTENAPSNTGSDNGLTWNTSAGVVNDAAGTNNGYKGLKMNGSGWCYFTKAAVAGKLKLTFGPRKANQSASLKVSTWTGETPAAETEITTTATQTESNTQIVELTAEQNNIYITRGASVETVLQKIEFKEDVARTFVDFKIEFRDNPYTVLLPANGELPAGVLIENTNYNGGQHGIYGGKITVPVDGPVKFTIGACQFSGTPIVISKDGVKLLDFSNNAACGETAGNFAQYVTYTYTGEAGTLTFELAGNTYIPYFFAEATDVTPCEIIFKDQNGAELGRVETIEGATLEAIPYSEADLPTIGEGNAFRGWFYTSGKKAKAGDVINGNTTIQAKVTPIETVTLGSIQTYDFANQTFYPEDHETVTVTNGAYHDGTHGWYFADDGSIDVQVAGNAVVVIELCKYSETSDIYVLNGTETVAEQSVIKNETPDGTQMTVIYEGEATTLTIKWDRKQYIHKVTVYNVVNFPEKDDYTGYYFIVPAGDAASFILTLTLAEEGDKIFLPNGIYDLGETVLTTISKNNISIIGQSMEGVIIKNAPDAKTESIDKTATLRIAKNVTGTYIQDLTIQNALDYYKANNGRAVALWDQGTKTVCKNVKLLSYQDTYYSNLQGAVRYFEDCEIHGTVDFICGDGSVYFKNNLLYAEKRNASGGGSDALTASNADALEYGYIFESCTIKSECPVVSFGRAWNHTPQVTFLNTLVDYSAGEFSFVSSDGKIQRWTKELMNAGAWPMFAEYNTHLADGTVLTPASNEVEFIDTKSGNATNLYETVLAAEGAALRTMEYTLGDWAATAKAEAEQKRMNVMINQEEKVLSWNATEEGVYMVCLSDVPFITTETSLDLTAVNGDEVCAKFHEMYGDDLEVTGGYYVRFANGRGGFGPKVWPGETPEGIENTAAEAVNVKKIFRDGQLIIIKNNNEYNALGGLVK